MKMPLIGNLFGGMELFGMNGALDNVLIVRLNSYVGTARRVHD
jgi:hypothetical protein